MPARPPLSGIAQVFPKVHVDGHTEEILQALQAPSQLQAKPQTAAQRS